MSPAAGVDADLLVKVSTPSKVDKVPVVGKVILVLPEVVNDKEYAPVVLKDPAVDRLPPRVIVLPLLFTPVPPFAPKTTPVTFVAFPDNSPMKLVAVTEAKPEIVFVVAPKSILVLPNCIDLSANWFFVIPAVFEILAVVIPDTEIVFEVKSIPDPLINKSCLLANFA